MPHFKKVFGKIWSFCKKNKKTSVFILAVALLATYFIFGGKADSSPYESYIVDRGEIIQEVSATGKVTSASQSDLSFDRSGRVVGIYVSEGDYVFAGEGLAKIDDSELQTKLLEAEADLKSQEIKLSQLEGGTRAEEIDIAKNDLKNAYLPVADILNDASNKVEDALYKQVDPMFDNDNTEPQINFTISDTQTEIDVESGRLSAELELSGIKKDISGIDFSSYGSMDKSLESIKNRLLKVADFLSIALKTVNVEVNLSDATVSTYKANIGTARTNVQAAIEAITAQQKSISSAGRTLTLKEAGSTSDDIEYQKAQVDKMKAQVENIKTQIAKSVLVSPINAIITKKEINVGEFSSAGQTAFSVISRNNMEVESNVPEVDVAKMKVGNEAKITLDAFGPDEVFTAKISKINPGETVIEGVSTYKVTFAFNEAGEKIKSGMTANIDILTDKKEGLRVPQRAISRDDGKNFVRLLPMKENETPAEREVKIGLRGSDGMAEIISGLEEGEKVITFEKK